MGNMQCPIEDAARLAAVARDVCPFPDYNPSPLFTSMLSINSSLHLRNHYTAVQSSLDPDQLQDFTRSLRRTFGREGKVSYGGVGVVALSLAVLFDTLAKKAKGEWVSDSGPIPGLFLKDLRGYYPQQVHSISEYLRLVPYIANNPQRMKEETERYIKQLKTDEQTMQKGEYGSDDISGVNQAFAQLFQHNLKIHLTRITNSTDGDLVNVTQKNPGSNAGPSGAKKAASQVGKARKKRIPAPETYLTFNLNCDPVSASKDFLDEVKKTNDSEESYRKCFTGRVTKTPLHYIARLAWLDVINSPIFDYDSRKDLLVEQKEDFDLKATAQRGWAD